ncbi:MAG: RNA methyltransferase [Planctomycetaceae bacterium]|nr:RNA methyltransferase [Planctomycetaceae bacterium]|tara:strand:+ start:18853 stop:19353 length:501 start_codon:yes stop_codon:yes gene_type:complete
MNDFVHQRHKPPTELMQPRKLVLACPEMRSNVNVARMIRAAACCGIQKFIACGNVKVDPKISREGELHLDFQVRRSLLPVLKKLKTEGYPLIGLEQTSNSANIHEFRFPRKCVLVIGHERHGIKHDVLEILDATVEIPVWGMPYSYNAATATTMALYEYCRQYPNG